MPGLKTALATPAKRHPVRPPRCKALAGAPQAGDRGPHGRIRRRKAEHPSHRRLQPLRAWPGPMPWPRLASGASGRANLRRPGRAAPRPGRASRRTAGTRSAPGNRPPHPHVRRGGLQDRPRLRTCRRGAPSPARPGGRAAATGRAGLPETWPPRPAPSPSPSGEGVEGVRRGRHAGTLQASAGRTRRRAMMDVPQVAARAAWAGVRFRFRPPRSAAARRLFAEPETDAFPDAWGGLAHPCPALSWHPAEVFRHAPRHNLTPAAVVRLGHAAGGG